MALRLPIPDTSHGVRVRGHLVFIGQQWRRRDGAVARVQAIDSAPEDGAMLVKAGNLWYFANGKLSVREEPQDEDLIDPWSADDRIESYLARKLETANDIQIGGEHYKSKAIQPWDFIASNNIPFLEGNAIKYLARWRDKGGIEDLKKAQHYVQKAIEVAEARVAQGEKP